MEYHFKSFSNRFVPSQLGDKLYKLAKILKEDDSDFYRLLISSLIIQMIFWLMEKKKKGLIWQNNFDTFFKLLCR